MVRCIDKAPACLCTAMPMLFAVVARDRWAVYRPGLGARHGAELGSVRERMGLRMRLHEQGRWDDGKKCASGVYDC
eukprot:Skav211507  [mRNA]  locus=scaffold352:43276:49186:- [translate_table: standard]